MFQKIGTILLSWCLLIFMLGGLLPVHADGAVTGPVTVTQAIDDAAAYITAADGNALLDWDAYALAKAGKSVPYSYLTSVGIQLQQNGGLYNNVTDYDRIALAVKAAGGNPEQITSGTNSFNLIQNIYNSDVMTAQGTNGAIYSLLALSSGTYNIPLTAKWTPDKIVGWLIAQKNADGGWPLNKGEASNVDLTGAALNALSAYKTLTDVQQAIDGGVQWLSSHQLTNGGFSEHGENAESTAQVILGLSAVGIDARSSIFTKTNGNPLSYIFSYRQSDGGFANVSGGSSSVTATGEVLMALAAYETSTGGISGSYDAILTSGIITHSPASVSVHIAGKTGIIAEGSTVTSNAYDAVIQVLQAKGITPLVSYGYIYSIDGISGINSTNFTDSTYWWYNVKHQGSWDYVNTTSLGMSGYYLSNNDAIYLYYSGYDTAVVKSITVEPAFPVAGQAFKVKVQKSAWNYGSMTEDVTDASSTVESSVYVELGSQRVQTDSQGVASFSGLPDGTYQAVVTGNRPGMAPSLVTDSQTVQIGTAPGPVVIPTVYMSVTGDSNKGTILSSTSVPLQSGDTPYSILIRTLGASRVQSSGAGSTAYVRGIDGLSEFDGGPRSGWMYAVNGIYLGTGADSALLKSGDTVSWRYTLNGGKDLDPTGTLGAGVPSAPISSAFTDAIQTLELAYDNQKPINEISKPSVVWNADKIMSADTAETLKKELAANTVNVQKAAFTNTKTDIADDGEEIQLQIPTGAVKGVTGITVEELPSSDRNELVSSMYEFGPTGTSFDKPIQISIKTPIAAGNLDQLTLAWLNEKTGQWIPIPAVIDAETGMVTGLVNHFTKFAVIDKSKVAATAVSDPTKDVGPFIERASKWLKDGSELSDWSAYALSRAGVAVGADYLASVTAKLKENNGTFRNVTDYERLALSVQAAGGNPEAIGGFNLIERIYNNERMEVQGSNGPIYALLALNGGTYRIPTDAKWPTEKLLQWILDVQNEEGSWPLMKGETGNPDLTAAALASLAPYKERAAVKKAMERAIKWLGSKQSEDGGFALDGVENTESTAQVIWGLSVSGTDPVNSSYFKTGNKSMLAFLLGLQLSSGAFPHKSGGDAEVMATEQALMALGAYQSYLKPVKQAPSNPVAYADQKDISSWALSFVNKASTYRIMEGTGESVPTFEPKKQITRIQFVAMLLRIMGEAPSAEVKTNFADVAPDSWYAGYVSKAVAKGIVEGVSTDRFAPDVAISRQEMAIMLAKALQLKATGTGSTGFTDLNQSYPMAVPYIQAVQEKGLMEGDESGRFLPQDSATREMAAVVAVRAYELTKKP